MKTLENAVVTYDMDAANRRLEASGDKIRYRLIPRPFAILERFAAVCPIAFDQDYPDVDCAIRAARAMLSVLDYVFGCDQHQITIHPFEDTGRCRPTPLVTV